MAFVFEYINTFEKQMAIKLIWTKEEKKWSECSGSISLNGLIPFKNCMFSYNID